MPILRVTVVTGRSESQEQSLIDVLEKTTVNTLAITDDSVSVQLIVLPKKLVKTSTPLEQYMLIEILCFSGRDTNKKRELFSALSKALDDIGEQSIHTVMFLNQQSLDNWGIYGGQLAEDL